MPGERSATRRTVLTLAGIGATSMVVSVPAVASGGGLGFTNIGVNKFDTNEGDGDIDVEAERDKRAVHFTGGPKDYITSGANVQGPSITIGDFTGSDPSTLTYEYYGGPGNEVSAPDEVWLRLVESDGTEHEVYRAENDGNADAEEWRTRNVHRELRGNPDFNQGFTWFEVDSDGVEQLSTALIDDFADDVQITRMAAGRGTFNGDDDIDIKYRDPSFEGHSIGTFPSGRGR